MVYIIPFLSVIIGYLVAIILQPKNKKHIKLLMAFSGSFLLTLTVTHLLPEVYEHSTPDVEQGHSHGKNLIGFYIMLGIVFQIVLEYFSKGAEHGHVHIHNKLDKIPWLLFISLCIHALLEGMPLSKHQELSVGIAIHHLPISVILTAFFIQGEMKKNAILFCMVIFALMTPLGTLISTNVGFLNDYYPQISAVVVGILFHISSTIIFESNEDHSFNINKLIAIISGVILAYFV